MKVHGDVESTVETQENDKVSISSETTSRTSPPSDTCQSPSSLEHVDRKPDITSNLSHNDHNIHTSEVPKLNDWFVCHPRPGVTSSGKDHSHFPPIAQLPSFHPMPIMQYS